LEVTLMIPNLDTMEEKELREFWKKYHRASRKDAAALIGDKHIECVSYAATLAAYAMDRVCAMGLRLEGKVAEAMTYEHSMELRLARIPDDLRW
jgi:hypothetical protein